MEPIAGQKFVQPFMGHGYAMITKPLKRYGDGTIKANFDVELAIDILTIYERLDVVVLVSGDGDFRRLVELVCSKGIRVEVVAFGDSTAAELRGAADQYIDLKGPPAGAPREVSDARSVLIAEDYPDFRAKLLAILKPLELQCTAVENGRQAIDVVRDLAQTLHLVITDMDMPVHTGWEVIHATREHRGEELPIIMQTGEARYTYVRRRAAELDIVLLDKTDVDELLLAAVRKALRLNVARERA